MTVMTKARIRLKKYMKDNSIDRYDHREDLPTTFIPYPPPVSRKVVNFWLRFAKYLPMAYS